MNLSQRIAKLRTENDLSQEKFANMLGVSRQAVQKWEKGIAYPDLQNLIQISKMFHVTLDNLAVDANMRTMEELVHEKKIQPSLQKLHDWEIYSANLSTEFRQSMEEGLDIAQYEDLFKAVKKMPLGENKEKIADVLFSIVLNAPVRKDYKYNEPSDSDGIFALRNKDFAIAKTQIPANYRDKVAGAWYGRIAGCLLGKPIECIKTNELIPLLKQSNNYPMHRYILSTDITQHMYDTYEFWLNGRPWADTVDGMPTDDDTNYTVLYQKLIDECGRDFTPEDVSKLWISSQPRDSYCTAERVAFRNFINGYLPPHSAIYKNPFREWIGAQIRGDYFGYINPGNPEMAANMAWRDGCIAQTKNGIYGEMFVAAMLACASVTDDIETIIRGGLSQIPSTSRLYEKICTIIDKYNSGIGEKEFFDDLHVRYDEHSEHDWCHTISNAEIVAASLLYGKGDYGRSICMAVEQGFDTDCNGATVGSIIGMRNGLCGIDDKWLKPLNNKVITSIFGVGTVSIDYLVDKTITHLQK